MPTHSSALTIFLFCLSWYSLGLNERFNKDIPLRTDYPIITYSQIFDLLSFSSLQAIPGIVLCLNTLCAAISGSWQVLFLSMGSLTTHLCMVSFACHLCLPGCHLLTILIRNRSPLSPNPVCFVYPIVLCTFISFFFSSSSGFAAGKLACLQKTSNETNFESPSQVKIIHLSLG